MSTDKIEVSHSALYQLLQAFQGPRHHVLEIHATMNPAEVFKDNPVNILSKEYNEWAAKRNSSCN